jgi:hypothetical protein
MSGSTSIGRCGGHVGCRGPSCGHGDDDDAEAKKRCSDAARLHGSRRFTNYGLRPPPKFNRWEAGTNQGYPLPDSPASVPAASRRSLYDMPTPPHPTGARIGPEYFVAEETLPRILELIEESSHRDVELAAKWKREAEL